MTSLRDTIATQMLAHWPTSTSGCHCGGVQLGESFPHHLADAVLAALDDDRLADELFRLERLRALVREYPPAQVPQVSVPELARILGMDGYP